MRALPEGVPEAVVDGDEARQQPSGNRRGITSDGPLTDRESTAAADEQDSACAICMASMNDDIRTLGCGHRFHQRCIDKWLQVGTTCPICKRTAGKAIRIVRVTRD